MSLKLAVTITEQQLEIFGKMLTSNWQLQSQNSNLNNELRSKFQIVKTF